MKLEIHDNSIQGNGQYFISNGRILEAGRKNRYPYEYSIFIMELQTEILWKNNYNNIYFGAIE